MLFNSYSFILLYLPAVLGGWFWLARRDTRAAIAWLAAASLLFYACWDWRFLPLLLASILFNFVAGRLIAAAPQPWRRRRLAGAIAANLLLLAWFKYADFLAGSAAALAGRDWQGWGIVLPVGISFFTFTQIAYLVDCHRGGVPAYRLVDYTLFVSYFPHLVAGPVLHHGDMLPQFAAPARDRPVAADLAVGLSIFIVGLAKKVLVADNLAPVADPVFVAGAQPQLVEAWLGTLAYTFQLYFDFSGYSDMAIGLSRLFGVRLPLNFDSPYQARDIADFWRRWHMTLSRFLRDYLYIPLGGSRHGPARRYRNLLLTMVLGGLWHGAGWTFVLWGALHGVYLVLQQAWRRCAGAAAQRWWAWPLTFAAVMLAWVPFRAPGLTTALQVWQGLAGLNGVALPHGLSALAPLLSALGIDASFDGIRWIDLGGVALPVLAFAACAAFLLPNSQQLFARHAPAIDTLVRAGARWHWRPSGAWCLGLSTLFVGCAFSMNRVSAFLYFQF